MMLNNYLSSKKALVFSFDDINIDINDNGEDEDDDDDDNDDYDDFRWVKISTLPATKALWLPGGPMQPTQGKPNLRRRKNMESGRMQPT